MAKEVQREGLYDRNSPANRARGRADTKAGKDAQSQADRRATGGLHSSASAKDRKSTKAKTVQREGLYDNNSPANRARGRADTKAGKDAQSQANRRATGGLHSSAAAQDRKSTKAKTVQREGLYDRNSPANRARGRADTKAGKDAQSQANRRATGGLHSSAAAQDRKSTKAKTGPRDSLYGADPNRVAADKRQERNDQAKAKREEEQRRKADERETRKRSPRRSKDDTSAQQDEQEKREREQREKRKQADEQRESQRQTASTKQDQAKADSEQKTPKLAEVPAERGGRDSSFVLPPVSRAPITTGSGVVLMAAAAAQSWDSALSSLTSLS